MQKLDRYVSSYFFSSYGVCLLFFVGMFVLIDLFAKSDDVFENTKRIAELGYSVGPKLLEFYALMVPFIFLQVAPFVTVMAAMFAMTRLRRSNELVPMIVSGRSVYRVLVPIFVYALFLGGIMVMVQQFVAPPLADRREKAHAVLFDGEERREVSGQFPGGEGVFVTIRDYDLDRRVIAHFDVSRLDSIEPPLIGKDGVWNEERGAFTYLADVEVGGVMQKQLRELPSQLTPAIIEAQDRGPHDLSYSQAEFLFRQTGQDRWKVLLHYHLTFPLSNVLLLLLGLPFVLKLERRSLMLGMVISILICAAYFAFDAILRNLGEAGVVHPVLAAWFGVILFGSLGVVLLDGVKT